MGTLSELTSGSRRLAVVGLAKNTGKTVALTTVLRELDAAGARVGVTSIGRDGEARDVLDERIEKPAIHLRAGSLVATTEVLLRESGLPWERVEETALTTPLGRVAVARLEAEGDVEVAGPGTIAGVRAVAEAMERHGAQRVLIDGALDRRASASPAIADGIVVATGAALHQDPAEVARRTAAAVELLRLPLVADEHVRAVAGSLRGGALVAPGEEPVPFADGLALDGGDAEVATLLRAAPNARHVVVGGALVEAFVAQLAVVARTRPARELTVVVADGTRVFLRERTRDWYARQGVAIEALAPIELHAITVNPLAPRSHRFDPDVLPRLVAAAVPGVPVLDVMSPAYMR